MNETKSETLARLWPEHFGKDPTDKELLDRCLIILKNIVHRYDYECNPHVTRRQISEIQNLISLIATTP